MTVHERLKKARKLLGFNQKDFANELGISQTHISSIENGKDNPSTVLLKLLSIKFNISEQWLINGTGSPDTECDMNTDEGVMSKYNDMRVLFERILRNRTGNDLVNTVNAFSYLVSILSASKLNDKDATNFLEHIQLVIDDFEKLTFMVSNGTLPSKNDTLSWLQYKNRCVQHADRISKNIKNAVNLYLIQYGEEMQLY